MNTATSSFIFCLWRECLWQARALWFRRIIHVVVLHFIYIITPKKTTWWLSISSSKTTTVTQKSLFYPWFNCIPSSQMWSFSFQHKLNYWNSQLIIKTKWKLKHNLLLELHSLEALQPGSSTDMRWLQSYISVKVSVLAFKASKNLGQAFRKTDSSLMTFEASAVSRIEEERKGKWGEEGGEFQTPS